MATNTTATSQTHNGNGSTASFAISFSFLDNTEVDVRVGGVLKTITTHYTISGSTVTFTSGNIPPSGTANISFTRDTNISNKKVDFADGSVLTETDLDNNSDQILFAQQEFTNDYVKRDGSQTITGDLVFEGATDDDNETTLAITNPTADRTITIPDITGTVVTTGDTGTVSNGMIAGDAVTNAKIADDSIDSEHYVDGSVDTQHIANENITTAKLANDAVTSAKLADNAVVTANITDSNVTTAKIADSNVTTAKIAADAINGTKIADDSINSEHIVDGSIDAVHLAADVVDGTKIADDSINSEHYVDGSIDTAHIADSQITSAKIADGTIVAGDLASDSVTTAKITDANVTTAKIADSNITTAKIADSNVTTAKIADSNITTAKIADDAVTNAKIADGTLDGRYYTETELDAGQLDNRYYTETELNAGQLDNRYYTETESDARYFNISTGDTIKDGDTFPDNDTTIATTAAINDRIIDLVDDVGGFVPIASETNFPTANPDVNNGSGTLVSIKAIGSTRTPSGGTVSISNGSGSNTVTITGCGSTVLTAGFGVIVETTSTLHTYAFHRLVPKATEVTTVAANATNIAAAGANTSNINSVVSNASNINTVAGISSNVTTVAGVASNVTTVAGISSDVTAVAADATDIGAVAAKATEIGRLGTADAVADMNTLGTTAIVSDLDTLADISSNITTVADISSNVTTVAGISSNVTSVANNSSNINSAVSNASNINAAVSNASNINTVAGNNSNITTVAGANSNITTVAGANSNISTVASAIANVNTTASNISNVNNFAEKYQIASSDPSTDGGGNALAEGDLYFNTTADELKVYNGGAWQGGVTASGNFASTTGNTFTGSNIHNDNVKSIYGTSSDGLEIFHNASDSVINDQGTGSLKLQTGGSTKIEVTSTGTSVTGNIVVSGNVDGRDIAADGTKLDGIESSATADQTASEIVALIADQTIAPSTIDMEDNEKILLGTGDDFAIFHDGSNTYLTEQGDGTGQVYLRANSIELLNNSNETYAKFLTDGAVELFHNNSKKFETSSSGGTLTGTLVADAFTGPLTGNVTGNASGSSGSCTGNAATATALASARTIAGVSFDGSANISLNNNAITNGAGYITATLTNEQVQDIIGGMLTGNTETGITVTYQDGDGTIDFVVGTLNQDTTGSAATLTTARTIAGVSFDGSANISLNNNAITNGAGYITSADGGNAATLDSLDSTSFLRSDANDTMAATLTSQKIIPANDSQFDIGESGTRFANGYFDTLYGDGSNLTGISAGATGGGSDEIFYENGQNVTTNYTITNGKNAMSAGPITIDSGVTVTVGSGETLTIV